MRNPLKLQPNPGDPARRYVKSQDQGDAVEIVTPTPEQFTGENNPYRGTELHGVPFDADELQDERSYWRGTPVLFTEVTPDDVEPIPVRIIAESGNSDSTTKVRIRRTFINPGQTVVIANHDDTRTKLKIKHLTNATNLWIGSDQTVNAINGYPIASGEAFDTTATNPVTAFLDTAAPAGIEIYIMLEFTGEGKF